MKKLKTLWNTALFLRLVWFKPGKDEPAVRSGIREQWRLFSALVRMLRAWSAGCYHHVPAPTLLAGALALAYLISPVDALSDLIPVLGLLDDVTVLAFVLHACRRDLERFRHWEDLQRKTIDLEVTPAVS